MKKNYIQPSVVVATTIFENHLLAGTTNYSVNNPQTGETEKGTVQEGNPKPGIGGAAKQWGVADWDDANDQASIW